MPAPTSPSPHLLESTGLAGPRARELHVALSELFARRSGADAWSAAGTELLRRRDAWGAQRLVFEACFAGWDPAQGPPPAWVPSPGEVAESNIGRSGLDWPALHARSVQDREAFWPEMLDRLGILLAQAPSAVLQGGAWLPGARLNIASSCFQNRDPNATAIVHQRPGGGLRTMAVQELHERADLVARCLREAGFVPRDAVAVHLPRHAESVVVELGIVLAGCTVVEVGVDCPTEQLRPRLVGARAVITQDIIPRAEGSGELYARVVEADGPRAIVLPALDRLARPLRPGDCSYGDFLATAPGGRPKAHRADAGEPIHVRFDGGGAPPSTRWSHLTPIRAATEAWAHHDLRPGDVVAWPAARGCAGGPWLPYAALLNGASLALFDGEPDTRAFCSFVQDARVTMLGTSPELIRSWRAGGLLAGLEWDAVRCFSSTGDGATFDDSLWLSSQVNHRAPVIEYGAALVPGGGVVAGTVVQAQAPATYSTAAIGCRFDLLDAEGQAADSGQLNLRGSVFAATPPDDDAPAAPRCRLQRLPGGWYRSLP